MIFTLSIIKAYYNKNYISFMDLYSKSPEFSLYNVVIIIIYLIRWFINLLLPKYRDEIWNILLQSFLSLPVDYCKVYINSIIYEFRKY